MESLNLKEKNIVKDLFRLKEEQNCTATKDIRNLFIQEKKLKLFKIMRDINQEYF